MEPTDEREEEARRLEKKGRGAKSPTKAGESKGPGSAAGKRSSKESQKTRGRAETKDGYASRRWTGLRHGSGTGLPPDPWSATHPPPPEHEGPTGENGGFFGRGPLRVMYEHKYNEPSSLPPERGRSPEQGYLGRSEFQATDPTARLGPPGSLRRWFLPAIVILVTAAAYLLSQALTG